MLTLTKDDSATSIALAKPAAIMATSVTDLAKTARERSTRPSDGPTAAAARMNTAFEVYTKSMCKHGDPGPECPVYAYVLHCALWVVFRLGVGPAELKQYLSPAMGACVQQALKFKNPQFILV